MCVCVNKWISCRIDVNWDLGPISNPVLLIFGLGSIFICIYNSLAVGIVVFMFYESIVFG